MEVAFILSLNELFTLMSMIPGGSDAGRQFSKDALPGASMCDLGGLAEKKLARYNTDGKMELMPVVRMLTDALARADSVESFENGWIVRSPWITLQCENYPYNQKHLKITPIKNDEAVELYENTD